jgi:hypothetical protein
LGVYDKRPFNPDTNSVDGVEDQSMRLRQAGGNRQQERMIKGKRRSLDRAVWSSYQAAEVIKIDAEDRKPVRALINPNKLKQDYFSAIANGNLSEATRIYDIIDKITGGKADYFIAVQYNSVKFYKKMQKQLLIDMFANFVILMILSEKHSIKDGIVKFNKLYRAFIQKELGSGNFGLIKNKSIKVPEISKITISVSDDRKFKGSNVKAVPAKQSKAAQSENQQEEKQNQTFISFVKEKINHKLSKLKKSFEERIFSDNKHKLLEAESKKDSSAFRRSEQNTKILESD